MNRRKVTALLFALSLTAIVGPRDSVAGTDEVAIVVNSSNPLSSLNKDQLSAIYRVRSQEFPGGAKAEPVNLPPTDAGRQLFDQVVLGMSPDEAKRFWIDARIRSGTVPPKKVPSASAVLRHVSTNAGGLGYLPVADAKGVKIVARLRGGKVVGP